MLRYPAASWRIIGKGVSAVYQGIEDEVKDALTAQLITLKPDENVELWRSRKLAELVQLQERIWQRIMPLLGKAHEKAGEAIGDAAEIVQGDLPEAPTIVAEAERKFIDDFDDKIRRGVVFSIKRQAQNINRIADDALHEIVVRNAPKTQALFGAIDHVTRIDRGLEVPVQYSNGRHVSLRSYLDMRVRECIQTMSLDYLTEGSQAIGVKLFLVSEHADCAEDHRAIQGKVCTDDPVLQRERGYLDLAMVKQMLRRPNCRHYLIPITQEQAEHPQQTLRSLKMTKGHGDNEKNYKDLQMQRRLERGERMWKARLRNDEQILGAQAIKGTPEEARMKAQRLKDKRQVMLYQKRIRLLLASNPNLVRAENREQIKTVTADLGITLARKSAKS